MTALDFAKLNRRRDPDRDDCWFIFCGDIHAGTIARANGMPNAQTNWNWSAGFYPGSHPREIRSGCAETFEEARANFLPAWLAFAQSRTEGDFAEWREWQDWTARKYAARDAGLPCPMR